jgi:hypothetical protein
MASDNKYPFETKASVRRRLEHEAAFVVECLALMQARHELRLSGVETDGPCGWTSSQASMCAALAKKSAAGSITPKELAEAARLLKGYRTQITSVLRERALEADPALGDAARIFGVLPVGLAARGHSTNRRRREDLTGGPDSGTSPETAEPAVPTGVLTGPAGETTAGAKAEPAEPAGREELNEPPAVGSCEVCQGILDHVSNGRGGRAAEIAAALGVGTAEASKHLRDLLDQGRVRKVGFGRGTTYLVS